MHGGRVTPSQLTRALAPPDAVMTIREDES